MSDYRHLGYEDIPQVVELGRDFFAESELPNFADFSADNFEQVLYRYVETPGLSCTVFAAGEEGPQGFLMFAVDSAYTVEPIALLHLFYVAPAYRRGLAGRAMLRRAIAEARGFGATVFYAGVMSGIESVQGTMANMYTKAGFEPLPFWGRRVLV